MEFFSFFMSKITMTNGLYHILSYILMFVLFMCVSEYVVREAEVNIYFIPLALFTLVTFIMMLSICTW
jgi:hypothetical protein